MSESIDTQDLQERLQLIESMIAEGRQTTEGWGWVFVLWGMAYVVAIVWSGWINVLFGKMVFSWPANHWSWIVTMFGTAALTLGIGTSARKPSARNRIAQATSAVWWGPGISMMVIFPALGWSGRLDTHLFVALVAAILGGINAASSMILRWRAQFACAVVWWLTSAVACFSSERQLLLVFLTALLLCQIVFGAYAMRCDRKRAGARHA